MEEGHVQSRERCGVFSVWKRLRRAESGSHTCHARVWTVSNLGQQVLNLGGDMTISIFKNIIMEEIGKVKQSWQRFVSGIQLGKMTDTFEQR